MKARKKKAKKVKIKKQSFGTSVIDKKVARHKALIKSRLQNLESVSGAVNETMATPAAPTISTKDIIDRLAWLRWRRLPNSLPPIDTRWPIQDYYWGVSGDDNEEKYEVWRRLNEASIQIAPPFGTKLFHGFQIDFPPIRGATTLASLVLAYEELYKSKGWTIV